ncbi:MAG: PPC domain-containing protein [Planctomycetota bacterium]|nr:PPC domain-containing protein [Planctomycetota bacterium]
MPQRRHMTHMICRFTAVFAVVAVSSLAHAADPRLSVVVPRGMQRGTEAVVNFRGARLKDAQEIFFYDPGIEVVKIEPAEDGNSANVTLKAAPDCRLGEHEVQVRCASGVSEFRTFWIGALPELAEQEPNNEFDKPQPITLNTTVTGIVESEDVDYFTVEAKKGQRINVEIEGLRLGTQIDSRFDPYVAILNQDRFELSVADDTPLVNQDSVASLIAPEDGRYVIQVRDGSYQGNGNCFYRMHVGEFPRPLAVYPAGGPVGQETEVTFIGDPAGALTHKVTPPADPKTPFLLIPEQNGQIAPSANPFRVSPFANVLEQEPNGEPAKASGPASPAPIALNGVLADEEDTDFIKFAGTKGQNLRIECYARRLRTPIDPVLSIHKADGGQLAANDDNGGPDAGLDFTVPEDGEYLVGVRDHLSRSGPEYVYRVEIIPQQPELTLSIPRVQQYEQTRQQIVIPRGGRFGTLVNAARKNFGGKIVLETDRLPPGVTMIAEPMAENLSSMPVLFEAALDAPLGGFLVDLKGFKDDNREINGRFSNTADMMRYQNQEMLWTTTVDRLPVAVVEKLPYSIEIVEPKVPLVRNGSMNLKIIAKRDEGFTKPITIEFPFRPPGVGTLPNVQIPEGQNEVMYPLNADGNAQVASWKVYAVGLSDVGGMGLSASPFAKLDIADNYLNMAPERAAVVQAQPTEVYAKLEIKTPFEGTATAVLLGLPNKVVAEPVQITKDTADVRFKVTTDAESPVGRHQGLFAQVTIPLNGEEMVHRAAGVELRIDAPPPVPKEPEPKPAEPPMPVAQPDKPPEKPLSRLEQLRLEAKQRLEQGKTP